MTRVEQRIRDCAELSPADLDRAAEYFYNTPSHDWNCDARLQLWEALRDLAALKRLWRLPDTRPGSGDL